MWQGLKTPEVFFQDGSNLSCGKWHDKYERGMMAEMKQNDFLNEICELNQR